MNDSNTHPIVSKTRTFPFKLIGLLGVRTVTLRLLLHHRQTHHFNASNTDAPQRIELRLLDSKSSVLTVILRSNVRDSPRLSRNLFHFSAGGIVKPVSSGRRDLNPRASPSRGD